jgi:GNAT superfamily N-acetyltransferase
VRVNSTVQNIRIRPVLASDEQALLDFYAALSDDSRHARFLGCARGLDPRVAHNLCCGFGVGEAGFVAERVTPDRQQIVGHVCLTRAGANTLEIGIAVADSYQGHKLGHRLFADALTWAELNRIDQLVAIAYSDNWRVLRLLRESGHATHVRDAGAGVSTISIDLNDKENALRAA